MDTVKRRIKTRVEEIKGNRNPADEGILIGLREALKIIEEVENEAPRESWGDY